MVAVCARQLGGGELFSYIVEKGDLSEHEAKVEREPRGLSLSNAGLLVSRPRSGEHQDGAGRAGVLPQNGYRASRSETAERDARRWWRDSKAV